MPLLPNLQKLSKAKRADRVVHKSDLILVMGKDESELLNTATAVTFAIQSRPLRLEIGRWKSFVDVDYDLLDALEESWIA